MSAQGEKVLHSVNLSDGVAPAARLQNRACHFHGTRLLSNPILVTDTPLMGALRPEVSRLRPKSHPLHSAKAGAQGILAAIPSDLSRATVPTSAYPGH